MIPQPYTLFGGTAGSASEVDLDWIMDAEPSIVTTDTGSGRPQTFDDEDDDNEDVTAEAV